MGKLEKIKNKVMKISPDIQVSEERGCIVLFGELDDWEKIVECGKAAVSKDYLGVVNRIKLKGHTPKMYLPTVKDSKYDGRKPDVAIIGAGVVGSAIARELSKYALDVMLIEKEYDVALAASSRNDGEVHPGIDLHKGYLKLHYNSIGNRMYPELCKELGVEFKRRGQVVVLSKWWEKLFAPAFLLKMKLNGIPSCKYINNKKLRELNRRRCLSLQINHCSFRKRCSKRC